MLALVCFNIERKYIDRKKYLIMLRRIVKIDLTVIKIILLPLFKEERWGYKNIVKIVTTI